MICCFPFPLTPVCISVCLSLGQRLFFLICLVRSKHILGTTINKKIAIPIQILYIRDGPNLEFIIQTPSNFSGGGFGFESTELSLSSQVKGLGPYLPGTQKSGPSISKRLLKAPGLKPRSTILLFQQNGIFYNRIKIVGETHELYPSSTCFL